ncbi:hypothetical protein DCC39_05350 [Pueribacillus theae]|uniref:DUF4190 domain-containing protein n=1 Tax=Pueribacillus theae TaxID=2171751 RepID=A0A2U1K651_9BACI|nr:DUF308 domain-containing protein [Pueribacillus theae]PWA12443.1 hypothetical protein DCC39_05350 [Pueribacillus theae]
MKEEEFQSEKPKNEENPEQRHRFLEETAAEVVPIQDGRQHEYDRQRHLEEDKEENTKVDAKSSIGIFALVLSILSLLFMPIILGAAGIIVGFLAKRRDANTMGNWAIVIGAVSIIVSLFFSPFI